MLIRVSKTCEESLKITRLTSSLSYTLDILKARMTHSTKRVVLSANQCPSRIRVLVQMSLHRTIASRIWGASTPTLRRSCAKGQERQPLIIRRNRCRGEPVNRPQVLPGLRLTANHCKTRSSTFSTSRKTQEERLRTQSISFTTRETSIGRSLQMASMTTSQQFPNLRPGRPTGTI